VNKIRRVDVRLIRDVFSAHLGVEYDDLNMLCLGGKELASALAAEDSFLFAHFSYAARHRRRLARGLALETGNNQAWQP
jgi:ribose 5-phosphate isomerase RpiB